MSYPQIKLADQQAVAYNDYISGLVHHKIIKKYIMEKCSRIKCEGYAKEKGLKPCSKCRAKDKVEIAKNTAILNKFFNGLEIK